MTYAQYTALGYGAVSQEAFPRYEAMAQQTVRKYTQNRISDADLHPPGGADEAQSRVAEMNRRGVCEIIDALYAHYNPSSDFAKARTPLAGFSNGKYSESYAAGDGKDRGVDARIRAFLSIYFTAEQLWRGHDAQRH